MIPQIGMTCGCGRHFLIAARTGETYNCTCGREWRTNFDGSAVYLHKNTKPIPLTAKDFEIQWDAGVLGKGNYFVEAPEIKPPPMPVLSDPLASSMEAKALSHLVVFLLDQLGGSVVIPDSEFAAIQGDERFLAIYNSPEKHTTTIRIQGGEYGITHLATADHRTSGTDRAEYTGGAVCD